MDNIEEIAGQCDCLCIGTNGLTEELTGLDRSVLDHSPWMKERGYEGRSPFEVLVPEVAERVADAIARARKANPDIHINMCGHQTGGHDIDSVKTVLDMDVDQITVPPHEENYFRTQMAIAQHAARRELALNAHPVCCQGPSF